MSCFEMLKLIQVTGSSLLVGPASVAVSAAATTVAALAVGIVPGQVRPRKMAPTLMICWSLYYLPGNFDFHILPVRRYLRHLMKPGAIRHLNSKTVRNCTEARNCQGIQNVSSQTWSWHLLLLQFMLLRLLYPLFLAFSLLLLLLPWI